MENVQAVVKREALDCNPQGATTWKRITEEALKQDKTFTGVKKLVEKRA